MAEPMVQVSDAQAKRNVIMTAAIAGLGGLLFGYDTGIIASALANIGIFNGLSEREVLDIVRYHIAECRAVLRGN